jgi:aminopeptidase N
LAHVSDIVKPARSRDLLTRAEATGRARAIADVRYVLDLDLPDEGRIYSGTATVDFSVLDASEPLFLDFKGLDVTGLSVNGTALEADAHDSRVWLPGHLLEPRSSVTVAYRNRYDDTGDGFHRFVDPEDGEAYVYTNFEPFAAHRLFPCFDQPDLKATYRLTVTAPEAWEVISASSPESIAPLGGGRRVHRFAITPPFSTYLLAIVAGPYAVLSREHAGIPMRLFARKSLARQLAVDADELFTVTAQGLDYYAELFDQPFPFSKYDQLFMPEFNAGAMENVGAVTIHDGFVFRDPPTETQRMDRAEVVLHELAHMWFGDLVTMRWWDDLWLNESFATYVSFLALTEATRFTSAWRTFNGAIKLPAYRADRLPTTHPISADATDTETALLNFDDITYGKGAAVIKQLVARIGRDGFRDGLRTYFRRHAWSNASLADFLRALEEGSGADLGRWARAWLETSSLNTISAEYRLEDGELHSLRLEQSAPPNFPTLRPHSMAIALVSDGSDGLLVHSLPATIEHREAEVPGAAGLPSPALVFPNHGDDDYALASLDSRSLEFCLERLHELDDPLLRQQLWTTLWDMVWDVRLPSPLFLAACRRNLPQQTDLELLENVLGRVNACLTAYVPEDDREAASGDMLVVALDAMRSAESHDARTLWMRAAIGMAATPEHLEPLLDLVDGRATIQGLTIDQDMRWALAVKSIAFASEEAEERLAAEGARDQSDRGQRALLRAAAARPTAEAKSEAWGRIHGEGYGSYQLTRSAMQGFRSARQRELLRPYRDAFFASVRDVFATRDHPYARAYLHNLMPDVWAEPEVLRQAQELLDSLDPEEQALARQLRERIDDLDRAIRARQLAATQRSRP